MELQAPTQPIQLQDKDMDFCNNNPDSQDNSSRRAADGFPPLLLADAEAAATAAERVI